jgi:2-polyprenyl-3-methyl-5-hydroxy-6-metoxy-1,4-benzoquinol methylase
MKHEHVSSEPFCLACGSTDLSFWANAKDAEYLTTDETFKYYLCRECQSLSIDPVPRDKLNLIYPANYYSFSPDSQGNFLKSGLQTVKQELDKGLFKKVLANIPGDAINVLDVGGGVGWQLTLVRNIDPRVKLTQVVDIDAKASAIAEAAGHHYYHGTIEEFETTEKFDFIILLNLIEHVAEPLTVLRKVGQLLTHNGYILIKTPNHQSLDARVFRHRDWAGYHCPRHWVIFTRNSFRRIVQEAALDVVMFSYTQGAPFWAMSILFWLADKGWISITKARPAIYHPLFPFLSAFFAIFDFLRKPFARTSQMFFVLRR